MKRWATYHLLTRRTQPGFSASNGHSFTASLGMAAGAFGAVLAAVLKPLDAAFAQAQTNLEQIIKPPTVDATEPMLLQADEMIYDNDNARITARGNVEIYYGNYTLLADQIVYNRNANTLAAEGNVRMKDPDGAVIMNLLDNPRLTTQEVVGLAAQKEISGEFLEMIALHPRWGSRYRVRIAIVHNPSTPLNVAIAFLHLLMTPELGAVGTDTRLSGIVQKRAAEILKRRRGSGELLFSRLPDKATPQHVRQDGQILRGQVVVGGRVVEDTGRGREFLVA